MTRTKVLLATSVALLALCAPALAGVPRWGELQKLSDPGQSASAGIDGSGTVTAVWNDSYPSGGTFIAHHAAGVERFGPAAPLGGPGSVFPRIAVADNGGAAAIWQQANGVGTRLRAPGKAFGPRQRLPYRELTAGYEDIATGGTDAAVGWSSARDGQVYVAVAPLTGQFGAQQRVTSRSYDGSIDIAMNDRGDAVAVWSEGDPNETGVSVMAAYRKAGGRFGRREVVLERPPSTSTPSGGPAVIDNDGTATVAVGITHEEVGVAGRRRDGSWGLTSLGPGEAAQLAINEPGDIVAWWRRTSEKKMDGPIPVPQLDNFLAIKPQGERFGEPRRAPGTGWGLSFGGFDGLRNAIFLGTGNPPEQPLLASSFSRFGLTEELPPLDPGPSSPMSLAVNRHGAAVATVFDSAQCNLQSCRTSIDVVERPADTSDPRVAVRSAKALGRTVTATVSCDEPCRMAATTTVKRKRARGRRATASGATAAAKARTVRPGKPRKIRVRLSRRQRKLIRRELAKRGRARIVLSVRAVDAAGNRRIARRTLRFRRR